MNKKYIINYQARDIFFDQPTKDFQIEVPTREEAEQKAEDLQAEGYDNIIIEESREI